MGALDIVEVTLPVVGAASAVGWLWWRGREAKRGRVTGASIEAERVAELAAGRRQAEETIAGWQATAAGARAVDAPTVAVDPNPTGRGVPIVGDGKTLGLRWLRPDLGQPTPTLPPVAAPTGPPVDADDLRARLAAAGLLPPPVHDVDPVKTSYLPPVGAPDREPIPLVPVDPTAPTPLAPDHWQHMEADPDEPTVCMPGPVPVPDPVALLSPTQAIERARLYRVLGNARREELDALRRGMENGAAR